MDSATAPAAGWFPDPGGSTSERWWSGDAWTEHTRQPLGAAVPAAFAAHVGTLVEERVEAPAEAPAEERVPEFAFAMTPTGGTAPDGTALSAAQELANPGRHVAPEDADDAEAAPTAAPALVEPDAPTLSRPPVPAALLESRASAAPVMTVPVEEPEPSISLPVAPAPAPVATSASAAGSAMAGLTMPSVPEPSVPSPLAASGTADASGSAAPAPATPAPPAPGVTMPSFADPVAPAPAAAAAAGFVMPNLASPLVMPDDAPAPLGRHADAPAYVPKAPKPEAPPAPAPVGFTSSADPTVANRYRQAIHTPEPAPEQAAPAFGAPMAGPASPAMPGWSGMPLPGGSPAAPGAAAFSPTPGYAAPGAPVPNYSVADNGSNKTAWSALGSGALAVGLAVFFLFFDRIGLWPTLLAFAAIVQGVIGLVKSRGAHTGVGPSIGAIVAGVAAIVIMASALVNWANTAAWDERAVEADIVETSTTVWELDVISADCPSNPPVSDGSHFTCTAYGSTGEPYVIDVDIKKDTVVWTMNY
jgi:hypothetical protein